MSTEMKKLIIGGTEYEIVDEASRQNISGHETRITALEQGGGESETGLSQEEKNLILTLFEKAAYAEDDAETAYTALSALWAGYSITWSGTGYTKSNSATSASAGASFTSTITANAGFTLTNVAVTMGGNTVQGAWSNGTVTIPNVTGDIVITVTTSQITVSSISAVYTQSGAVYDTDSLDSLKSNLVVTATFMDSTTGVIASEDYTLSGTLTEGTSTITVSYGGKTTTFNVTVSEPEWGSDYTWLYKASDGLLSTKTSLVTAQIGSGCSESIVDDMLHIEIPKGSALIRYTLATTTNTAGKLTAKVKFSSMSHAAAGNGFRLQISNGSNGAQIFERQVTGGGSAYFGTYSGNTYSDKLELDYNTWYILSVERTASRQIVTIDGAEILNTTTYSTNYCTYNAIVVQNTTSTDTPTFVLDIDWITYKNND